MSRARQADVAAAAAALASAGDLLLLYVANSQRPELGLPEAGRAWLWLGGTLGVVAIPFYALGYHSASRIVAPLSEGVARVIFLAGAAAALLGAAIHGLTAVHIDAGVGEVGPGRDPLTSLASGDPILLTLWALAAGLVLVASALFLALLGRATRPALRAAAWANPALLTVCLAAVGLPFAVLRSFLTPAAPNLAHLVFFVMCARALRADSARDEEGSS